ncbi:efflux RND transporter periplasmic adaptor subunit [Alicyclobacillus fodiniaquatilis]|jgi:multidrug resistance efflux pump|uniref:Efflux RND transporter periplasmic adaptor subunit n=1 Tax=Alicyclobacillus fodiniaquatilis TaxID=1661150 RepID=A0ABW4JBH6_9BACL
MLIMNVVIILVVIIAGFVGYYFYNQSTLYLTTDDAQVSGQQIVISAPATGTISDWKGSVGTQFSSGDSVGTVQVAGAKGTTSVSIPEPADGTIVQSMAMNNEFVAAGTPLAYAYDLNNLWVTANIKETQISDVKVGQSVDVYVDAYPGTTFSGVVKHIGLATAATFSMLPTENTNANYTKVTQVIPVQIQLQAESGRLEPGMSAKVRIHK